METPIGRSRPVRAGRREVPECQIVNALIAGLPVGGREAVEQRLRPVALERGEILAEAGESLEKIVFPQTAVIAKTVAMRDGRSVQTGIIGREGFVGIGAVLGQNIATSRFLVQHPGTASTIAVAALADLLATVPLLRPMLHSFIHSFVVQVLHMVACNSTHRIEQRCCRWLLMTHERIGSDRFPVTQEFLAELLGSHRSSIGAIAAQLQSQGLITYRRGEMTIIDRKGLKSEACDCARLVREAYAKLLPATASAQ